MSPTRRDILKVIAAAPMALALPPVVSASSVDADIESELKRNWQRMKQLIAEIGTECDESLKRLARLAIANGVELEQTGPRTYIARQLNRPGAWEIVTPRDCTCQRNEDGLNCEHRALVSVISEQTEL